MAVERGSLSLSALNINKFYDKSVGDEILIDKQGGFIYYNVATEEITEENTNKEINYTISIDMVNRQHAVLMDIDSMMKSLGITDYHVTAQIPNGMPAPNAMNATTTLSCNYSADDYAYYGCYVDATRLYFYDKSAHPVDTSNVTEKLVTNTKTGTAGLPFGQYVWNQFENPITFVDCSNNNVLASPKPYFGIYEYPSMSFKTDTTEAIMLFGVYFVGILK